MRLGEALGLARAEVASLGAAAAAMRVSSHQIYLGGTLESRTNRSQSEVKGVGGGA